MSALVEMKGVVKKFPGVTALKDITFDTVSYTHLVWTVLIEQISGMDKLPFTLYPKGGTAMLTCRQVGQAIACLLYTSRCV